MTDNIGFKDDLKQMIAAGQVTVVVGSGVSKATNPNAPMWDTLVASGIDRCAALIQTEALDWTEEECESARSLLKTGTLRTLLRAADMVEEGLKESGGGEFDRWIEESFKALKPDGDRDAVIKALASWEAPLLTTNYDDLIEQVTGLGHVTWQEAGGVTSVVRGDDDRVLHLHGHWRAPDSVVLGIRSYVGVTQDSHTRAVMEALGVTRSFVFVGCGDAGLNDPNWGRFLEWLKKHDTKGRSKHRHYRLVCDEDKETAESFKRVGQLCCLNYGKKHSELAEFLQELSPAQPQPSVDDRTSVSPVAVTAISNSVAGYLRRLEEHTKTLQLLGLGRSMQVELPIAEAYVPLRTSLQRSLEGHKTDRLPEALAGSPEEVDLNEVFTHSDELGLRGVVLLGEPGSGKTTGARQLAWLLASRQKLPQDLGLPAGITPVLLRFREMSRKVLARKRGGLEQFLIEQTQSSNAPNGLENPGPELWNAPGGLLWILDGLDEIVDPGVRSKVSGWIQRALRDRPNDRFLVTCRFQGYFRDDGVPLGAAFAEFHVRALDDDQVRQFVTDWFSAAYRRLGIEHEAAARVRGLLSILKKPRYQTGRMSELSQNPLLLTILCIVFHDQRELPTERAELYAECVRILLQHWRRERYRKRDDAEDRDRSAADDEPEDADIVTELSSYDAAAAQSVLARMAWWMHQEQGRTSAPLTELVEEARAGLEELSATAGLGLDGQVFIDRMREETGILAMSYEGDGHCGFLHLTFQEYLAAEFAATEGKAKELASRMADSWWRETALLSLRSTRPYCEEFFKEMLKSGIAEKHPNLAEQCLNEARHPSWDQFLKVLRSKRTKPERVAAVLRLLSSRADRIPKLKEVASKLANSDSDQVAALAREITNREVSVSASSTISLTTRATLSVERRPGAEWTDTRTGITYVWIPAGRFLMGSLDNEEGRWDDEGAQHQVELTQPFWLAKYPVTNEQYGRYMEAARGDVPKPEYWGERRFNQPQQPVVGVSWDEAVRFAKWAESALPTEAQWEYACRAGTSTRFCFGNDTEQLGKYAWHDANSNSQTQSVGTKLPNAWGLYDMHGNVWEWCQDYWSDSYSPEAVIDPGGPASGSNRVGRGGCWGDSARCCRSAFRNWYAPSNRVSNLGFRVASVPEVAGGGASVE